MSSRTSWPWGWVRPFALGRMCLIGHCDAAQLTPASAAQQVSKQIFEQMDQDGNGYIDRHEFSAIFSKGGLRITAEVEGQEFSGFMGFFGELEVIVCMCACVWSLT